MMYLTPSEVEIRLWCVARWCVGLQAGFQPARRSERPPAGKIARHTKREHGTLLGAPQLLDISSANTTPGKAAPHIDRKSLFSFFRIRRIMSP